jgi:CubicO group peptidase (beta-lactamase class C family)
MSRIVALVALLLVALIPLQALAAGLPVAAKPEDVGLSSARLALIERNLRADVDKGRIPGAVVLVARTYFWVDPKEQLVVVSMTQAPGPIRTHYRQLIRALVYQALE